MTSTTPVQRPRGSREFLRDLNPFRMLANLWRYRDLIRQFTIREVLGRYRGSYLGVFWSFISPLLMLSVYAFVFGVIFEARFNPNPLLEPPKGFDPEFALTLFCGMIVFNIFGETLMRAPTLITGNANYVKKVVFPLEILPVAALGSSLIHAAVSTLVLLAGLAVFHQSFTFSSNFFLAVPAFLPLIMLCCALAWIIASLGVFLRDLAQLISFIVQFMMFLTPIFYSAERVPQEYRWIMNLNPLAVIMTDARRALIWNAPLWWPGWYSVTAISLILLLLGYAWFMHSKKFFADVL